MPFGFDGPTGTVVPHAAVAFAFTDALADADADADAGPTVAQPSPGMGPVPAEIGEKVRSRHESGKRVVVEVLVTHARRAWSLP